MLRLLRAFILSLSLLYAMPATAQSACASTFQKSGNPILGLKFRASESVRDLSAANAINQLKGIMTGRGYDIILAEPEAGSMLAEQPLSGKARAIPFEINAVAQNGVATVTIEAKMKAAMFTKEADAKTEICTILGMMKGGKAGLALAVAGARGGNLGNGAPVAISALEFSHQISKDAERNAAAIPLRYKGKVFTLSGTVDYVMRDGQYLRVAFQIPQPWNELIQLPNAAKFKTDLSCLMAPGTGVYALQLKPGKSVKLTGTFYEYREINPAAWFKDCRPER
ncbi:hypothetical protein [Sphingomonas jaspsi]|uniref:hypothetical protein n=1 Tax=Sphingomonas jaspsi TaxID=392409 RepID=UPI000564F099|nr:hypothetical protein [Sphingomonas jaspsi]